MLIVLVGLSWRFRNLAKVEIVELWPSGQVDNKTKQLSANKQTKIKKGERHHDDEAS